MRFLHTGRCDDREEKQMLSINEILCKGCGYCIKYCPKAILEMGRERNKNGHFYPHMTDEDKCISCAMCATICPEGAIEITEKEEA